MNSRITCAAGRSALLQTATKARRSSSSILILNATAFRAMLEVYPLGTHIGAHHFIPRTEKEQSGTAVQVELP